MSGEGIGSQRMHGFNHTRSKRVKVDVAHQLLEVWIFLTENRFLAVLPPAPLLARRALQAGG